MTCISASSPIVGRGCGVTNCSNVDLDMCIGRWTNASIGF